MYINNIAQYSLKMSVIYSNPEEWIYLNFSTYHTETIKIQLFVYMYMYHKFLSLYAMFISLLIQFLKLSILIFGFEWRYPKLSTFSIHFIPNCHPLLEITDIPVNFWCHNRKVLMTQLKSDCWMMSHKPSRFLNRQRVYCVI
jgi:hypothetical protein